MIKYDVKIGKTKTVLRLLQEECEYTTALWPQAESSDNKKEHSKDCLTEARYGVAKENFYILFTRGI